MTSVQPACQMLPRNPIIDRATSLIRFDSARVAPEKSENDFENLIEPSSPFDLWIDDELFLSTESPSQSLPTKDIVHPTTRISPINNENYSEGVSKISEYNADNIVIRTSVLVNAID